MTDEGISGQDLEMRDRLTRVETKLDLVLDELRKTHADHETRIRSLETKIGRWSGGFAVLSVLLGAASGYIVNVLPH